MGVFNWPVRLESMDGERSVEFEAMVDTGASYTIAPASLLHDLGVEPIDTISLTLADGRRVEYGIGGSAGDGQRAQHPHTGRLRGRGRALPAGGLHP